MSNKILQVTSALYEERCDFQYPIFRVFFYIILVLTIFVCLYSYFAVLPLNHVNPGVCTICLLYLAKTLSTYWWCWIVIPLTTAICSAALIARIILDLTLKFAQHLVHQYIGTK